MQDIEARLRELGLRVTAPRRAVIAELREHSHVDVARLADGARRRIGRVSTQAIYDVVHTLTDAGILRSIELPGSPEVFELARGDNHHHMVCRACGRITDVPCPAGLAPCLAPSEDAGYLIDEAEVTYWGLCPGCHAKAAPRSQHHHATIINTH